ncbi:MAG: apolipoprotein N-acyltransferase [Betaproteobacteria bacterium]|nr:apolipoprotein N-acyltransferase [Betaproteobacteria bacterium]
MAHRSPSIAPRSSFTIRHSSFIIAFLLGAATVLGFAPFRLFPVPIATLAWLAWRWDHEPHPGRAAWCGFAFGLGMFLAGVSWIYVSLHDFGAMPAPLAAVATLLFCAYLALYPAAAGWLFAKFQRSATLPLVLLMPALWVVLEWTRGWLFTGFPWLAVGYSQVPSSPLAGYAPVFGIYGVSLASVMSSGLIAVLWRRPARNDEGGAINDERPRRHRWTLLSLLIALWAGGYALAQVEWTRPSGEPVTVSLLQGNIPQELKWREDRIATTLAVYRKLAEASAGRLVILPETALPLFLDDVPRDYLEALAAHARKNRGDVLIGVPEKGARAGYYNSVLSFGTAPTQAYRKIHLVPFGEFIPLRPVLGWIVGVLAIPLQDFSRGAETQQPLAVAGQRVAVNICYEDAFGDEIIRQLPHATLLVNVSNVAWFGDSIAPKQHLQISQARALETGRFMLRATNTGMTAVISPRGTVEAVAPEFTAATVTREVRGYSGATPYVRFGNYPALGIAALFVLVAFRPRRERRR